MQNTICMCKIPSVCGLDEAVVHLKRVFVPSLSINWAVLLAALGDVVCTAISISLPHSHTPITTEHVINLHCKMTVFDLSDKMFSRVLILKVG